MRLLKKNSKKIDLMSRKNKKSNYRKNKKSNYRRNKKSNYRTKNIKYGGSLFGGLEDFLAGLEGEGGAARRPVDAVVGVSFWQQQINALDTDYIRIGGGGNHTTGTTYRHGNGKIYLKILPATHTAILESVYQNPSGVDVNAISDIFRTNNFIPETHIEKRLRYRGQQRTVVFTEASVSQEVWRVAF